MKFKKDDYVEFYDSVSWFEGKWVKGKVVCVCDFPEHIIIVSKLGEENGDRYYAFKENSKDVRSMTIEQSIEPPCENPTNKLLSEILDELKAIRQTIEWKKHWWDPYTTTNDKWWDHQPQWKPDIYCVDNSNTALTSDEDDDNVTFTSNNNDWFSTHTYKNKFIKKENHD